MKDKILQHLELVVKLMELNDENIFKIKAYKNAIDAIYYLPFKINNNNIDELQNIKGIGSSILLTIKEYINTGNSNIQKKYLKDTPESVLELVLNIRGLGIKKISTLWKKHNIISIKQLYIKCKNDELSKIKGFGDKLQEKMIERINFYFTNQGFILYAKIINIAEELLNQLIKNYSNNNHIICGELRRQLPIIKNIEIISDLTNEVLIIFLEKLDFIIEENKVNYIKCKHQYYRNVIFYLCNKSNFGTVLFNNSCSDSFKQEFKIINENENEEIIFNENSHKYIPPYLRENNYFLTNALPKNIIENKDIKGLIHCHSNWSDGENSIEEMAKYCIENNLEYMLLTDHSKSSFIANGLSIERIEQQHKEIDILNNKLAPFKIFKGLECDILSDGNLDYEDNILQKFDLIIASVHNNLEMTKEDATIRVLAAIKNKYTHILGHSSGRLLLNRKGYDLDYDKIFDACVKYKVIIELNANPFRLDIDWQYLKQMKLLNIKTSINPDAHSINGIKDIKYGVSIAQKGAIEKAENLSSLNLQEFENYIFNWKKEKSTI